MKTLRTFTIDDQLRFAKLSGDNNPMHTDPGFARRLMLGKIVVHGVHTLMWGLDIALAENKTLSHISQLKVKFAKAIGIDEEVSLEWEWKGASLSLKAHVRHELAMTVRAVFKSESIDAPLVSRSRFDKDVLPNDADSLELGLRENLQLTLDSSLCKSLFPELLSRLPDAQTAAILLTSKTIGMHCPGLHSIFSGISLTVPGERPEYARYELIDFDERFSFATLDFQTPLLTGTLTAFQRPKPVEQPDFSALSQMVENNEFNESRALVIGGSRGLGEVTAKLLAAGGADIRITYHSGKAEADKLCTEIAEHGRSCSCFQLDISSPDQGMDAILEDGWLPTDVYYYPTPPIFQGTAGKFSQELFEQFCLFYVSAFSSILTRLRETGSAFRVLYPSTVAVDELPPNMMEYAAAKTAGESICKSLSRQLGDLAITITRFPRLDTDQTVSLYPVRNEPPAPLILATLREMSN